MCRFSGHRFGRTHRLSGLSGHFGHFGHFGRRTRRLSGPFTDAVDAAGALVAPPPPGALGLHRVRHARSSALVQPKSASNDQKARPPRSSQGLLVHLCRHGRAASQPDARMLRRTRPDCDAARPCRVEGGGARARQGLWFVAMMSAADVSSTWIHNRGRGRDWRLEKWEALCQLATDVHHKLGRLQSRGDPSRGWGTAVLQ